MSIQAPVLFLLAACLFVLASWTILRYQKTSAIRYYAGFLLSLSVLALAQGVLYLRIDSATALWFTRLGYLAGTLIFSMLLAFTFYYPIPAKKMPSDILWLWAVPLVIFVPLILSGSFVQVVLQDDNVREVYGKAFFAFPVFVTVYVVWSLANLIKKLPHVKGEQLRYTKYFMWVLMIATAAGLIFDVLLPSFGKTRTPIGIYSSSVLFGLAAYIVSKR